MDNDQKNGVKLGVGIGIFVVAFIVFLCVNPIYIISAGEQGVVLNWGAVSEKIIDEGINWRTPIMQKIKKIDVTQQKIEVDASAASKDMQTVSSRIALNYHLDPDNVNLLWQRFKGKEQTRVIDPAIQEAVKATTAKYTAEELITKREIVKNLMKETLKERLKVDFIIVDNVSIVNFDFSAIFNAAIESKQTAVQQALKAKNDLERVKFEADQKVAQAKAEAESIRLQSLAANNQKYIDLKALEVQLEIAKKWDGKLPVNMYAGAPLPLLNLGK